MSHNSRYLGWLLAGGALAVARSLFARSAPAKVSPSGTAFEAIDAYVEGQMRRLKAPGAALAIVEGDRIVHLRGFGRAGPDGEAPTPQTPFYIASVTKSFTALAVMQLVEAGKIDLDAPVQRYLPWFRVADPQASAQMTVRHLLYQTSGLPTSAGEVILSDFDDSPGATERQARALSTLVLKRPVGAAFEYSNSNYCLLGLIVEAASGESYADYVQYHIFNPLGMSHSTTSRSVAQADRAVGHQYWFALPFAAPNVPYPHGELPAGGLISSAEDMARYLIAHLNAGRCGDAQVLSKSGIDELHRGAADFVYMGRSFGQYGMGWFVDEIAKTKLVWHNGTLPNFFAYLALLPEQRKGVALLFNASHHWMSPVLSEASAGVAALLAGGEPQRAPIPFVSLFPAVLRGLLLIPVLQIAGVVATVRWKRHWDRDPAHRPASGRLWWTRVLLPLIPNALMGLALKSVLGKRRVYLEYYMPDYAWIARVCGSFSLLWSVLRTGLVVETLRSGQGLETTKQPSEDAIP